MTLYANNVAGQLAANIGPSDTAVLLVGGQGVLFPSPTAGNYFYVTLIHVTTGAIEIVRCTSRSLDTLTVVRGQDGTTPISFTAGSVAEMRLTAQVLRDLDYRSARGVANGIASLGPDGFVPYGQLGPNVPLLTAGKLNISTIPDAVTTDTELNAGLATRLPLTGGNMTGTIQMLGNGRNIRLYDNNQDIAVIEMAAGYASGTDRHGFIYNRNGAGFLELAAGNGTSRLRITPSSLLYNDQGVYHAGNFNPATKVNVTTPTSNGHMSHSGNAVFGGDITAYRAGSPDTGVLFLNQAQTRYLYWSSVQYEMPGGLGLSAVNFIATSDITLKKRIRRHRVEPGFANKILLSDWLWKEDDRPGTGVIAQQVLDYAPQHVTRGKTLGVDKAGLALECIVDLTTRLTRLERKANARPKSH